MSCLNYEKTSTSKMKNNSWRLCFEQDDIYQKVIVKSCNDHSLRGASHSNYYFLNTWPNKADIRGIEKKLTISYHKEIWVGGRNSRKIGHSNIFKIKYLPSFE